MADDDMAASLPALVLAVSAGLVEQIHAGVTARGFGDVRPAHGFAFVRLTPHGATVSELAVHLGVTRQAASQLVEELERKGYVRRRPHPDDARARLVVLTDRGVACTRAADAAAADAIQPWVATLGAARVRQLRDDLARLAPPGRLRPTW
ncbi:MAG: MarR family winged helix-turn-helix transcriptional regulator [Micromonosporaceae bacterium]